MEALTELEKVKLVNRICNKMWSFNQLFKPEGKHPIHPGVLQEMYKLLDEWMKQDNNFLRMEYDGLVMDNKEKEVNKSKDIKEKETTKSGWENKSKDIKEKETTKSGWDNGGWDNVEVKLDWVKKSKESWENKGTYKSKYNWTENNNQSGWIKKRKISKSKK